MTHWQGVPVTYGSSAYLGDLTITTNNDKSGYSLSAAGIDAIWDEPQSGHTTAGTFGYYLDARVSQAGGGGLTAQDVWTYSGPEGREVTGGTVANVTNNVTANVSEWAGQGVTVNDIAIKTTLAKGGDITGFNDPSVSQIWGGSHDGSLPVLDTDSPQYGQMLFANLVYLQERQTNGTVVTTKKPSGAAGMVFTLDDAVNPTSQTRTG